MSQSNKYREVYELYQLCSNSKDLKEFCIDAVSTTINFENGSASSYGMRNLVVWRKNNFQSCLR